MHHRFAASEDAALLGALNHQLIQDEGHRNPMSIPELETRMREWIASDYRAVLFEEDSEVVAYALYREDNDLLYLRQFFVQRALRRRGIGRRCMMILFSGIWPRNKRVTVDALTQNPAAISFWRSLGFADYALTWEIYPNLKARETIESPP
jgi:GNAT superfamily N-acetyltransferase